MESRQIHQFRSYGYNRSVEEVNSRWWTDSGLLVDPSSVSLPPIEIGPRDVSVSVSARLFFFRVPFSSPSSSPSLHLSCSNRRVFSSSVRLSSIFFLLSLTLSRSPSAPPLSFSVDDDFLFPFFREAKWGWGKRAPIISCRAAREQRAALI